MPRKNAAAPPYPTFVGAHARSRLSVFVVVCVWMCVKLSGKSWESRELVGGGGFCCLRRSCIGMCSDLFDVPGRKLRTKSIYIFFYLIIFSTINDYYMAEFYKFDRNQMSFC